MSYDGSIKIDSSIDSKGIQKGLSSMGSMMKSMIGALGITSIIQSTFSMIGDSISSAFDRADTMDQFSRTLTAITGDSKAVDTALSSLKDVTKGTAYGLDTAAKATQNFVTRGMGIEESTKRVETWADAVSFYGKGTNEELTNVTDALAKMQTKGKVEMDQLNRLFDVGIDAVGMYAKATGRSSAEVQNDLTNGRISSEEFISVVTDAMETGAGGVQKIAGAAKEAGTSWQGTFDNMKAACTRGMLEIINSIDNGLKSINLPTLKEALAGYGTALESTFKNVGGVIQGLIAEWGPLLSNIVSNVIQAFKGLMPAFQSIFSTIKSNITSLLTFFSTGFGSTIIRVIGTILSVVISAVAKVMSVVSKISNSIYSFINTNKILQGIILGVATAIAVFYVALKVMNSNLVATIVSLVKTIATTGLYQTVVALASAATAIFNDVLAANTIGLVVLAIAALIGGIVALCSWLNSGSDTTKSFNDTFATVADSANKYSEGLKNAKSHLEDFNDTLFSSSEEQQALQDNMDAVQKGITTICKTASDERRGYTSEEINQLDSYFEQLSALNQQQMDIQEAKLHAIKTQALNEASIRNGNLEDYKTKSQEWIKTAQEQSDKQIDLAKSQSIQEIALLNNRFGEQATMENAEYAEQYNRIVASSDQKISTTKAGVNAITQAYSVGLAEQSGLQDLYTTETSASNVSLENEQNRHAKRLQEIQEGKLGGFKDSNSAIASEQRHHQSELSSIWGELGKTMDNSQKEQLGALLSMAVTTKEVGGELDESTKQLVASMTESYKEMPSETKESLDKVFETINAEIKENGDIVYKEGEKAGQKIFDGVGDGADYEGANAEVTSGWENITNTIFVFQRNLNGIIQQAWTDIFGVISNVVGAIVGYFTEAVPNAINVFISSCQLAGELFGQVWSSVSEFFSNIWNGICNFFTATIPNLIGNIISWFGQLPGNIASILGNVISGIVSWAGDLWNKGTAAAKSLFDSVVDGVSSLPGKMAEIGGNIVKGVWEGITGLAGWLTEKVTGFFGGIVDGVKSTLGIQSPSKVFALIGGYMAEGVGVGFEDVMSTVNKMIQIALPTDFGISNIDTSSTIAAMQSAIAGSHATVLSNIGATTTANILSKLDTDGLSKTLAQACKEGCENANLSANVNNNVYMSAKQIAAQTQPYTDRLSGSVVAIKERGG